MGSRTFGGGGGGGGLDARGQGSLNSLKSRWNYMEIITELGRFRRNG